MKRSKIIDNWADTIYQDQNYPVIKQTALTVEEYDRELKEQMGKAPFDRSWADQLLEDYDKDGPVIICTALTPETYNEELRTMLETRGEIIELGNKNKVLSKVS